MLKGKKKIVISLIVVVCMLVLSVGYYVGMSRMIKYNGRELTPAKDYTVKDITHYLQNDPKWTEDNVGNSTKKMGGVGCLVSCVASCISDLGTLVDPQEVNNKLKAVDGFEDALLIWYKINEAIPEVDYEYSRIFSSGTIEKYLKKDLLPIVNVKYHGGGVSHWVVIIGAKDGEFLIYDPLNSSKEPMPLSTHGKVYAYRVLVNK